MTPTTGLMTLVALHAVAWAAVMVAINRLRERRFATCKAKPDRRAE